MTEDPSPYGEAAVGDEPQPALLPVEVGDEQWEPDDQRRGTDHDRHGDQRQILLTETY